MKRFRFVCAALTLCMLITAGCGKKNNAGLVDIRNSGTAVQWKYKNETEWHDLVSLDDLKGEAGKDGADGKNGTDGKNGVDGKDGSSVELRSTDEFIQWKTENGEWQNLVAISDITGPSGKDAKTAEFRTNENNLQWRYAGNEIWLNLYDLSLLKGADGKDGLNGTNGKDGANGKDGTNGQNGADGNTPYIGENGNWHIGDTDTGVKAAGEKGENGENGKDGKDGACAGYCYMWGDVQKGVLYFNIGDSYSDLIYYNPSDRSIRLKKGHIYNLNFSGSLAIGAAAANKEFGAALKDNYDDNRCVNATSVKIKTEQYYSKAQMPIAYNRFYNAQNEDIVLKLSLNDIGENTYFYSFNYSVTITALN